MIPNHCDERFECSADGWREYMDRVPEAEAFEAWGDAIAMRSRFGYLSPATYRRFSEFVRIAEAVIEQRFGPDWVPF